MCVCGGAGPLFYSTTYSSHRVLLKQKLRRRTRHLLWAPQEYKTKSLEKFHRADQRRLSVSSPAPLRNPVKVLGQSLAEAGGGSGTCAPRNLRFLASAARRRIFAAWFPGGGSLPLHAALCPERQLAMARPAWRRRTLERCLREVGKATDSPECFLT